jgi:hypothetical protein
LKTKLLGQDPHKANKSNKKEIIKEISLPMKNQRKTQKSPTNQTRKTPKSHVVCVPPPPLQEEMIVLFCFFFFMREKNKIK